MNKAAARGRGESTALDRGLTLFPQSPRDPTITQQHVQREELHRPQTRLTEPKFAGHPKITKAYG